MSLDLDSKEWALLDPPSGESNETEPGSDVCLGADGPVGGWL